MSASTRILYDSAHLRVIHRPGRSKYALITFSHATKYVDGLWFWGDGIAEKADLEAVGVVATSSNWFPVSEMERAASAIRGAVSGHTQVIGYGTSMGAYGVLKNGRLLGMTHALAFAPQWSINPDDVDPWDKRFQQHYRPKLHRDVAITGCDLAEHTAIIYDPFMRLDRLNFERIALASPSCKGIKSFCTGHAPVELFKGTSSIVGLFADLLAQDFAALQSRLLRARRDRASAIRPLGVAHLMVERDTSRASQILFAHAQKFTPRQRAALHHEIACVLHALDKSQEALQHAVSASLLAPERDFRMRLSMIHQSLGDHQSAFLVAKGIVDDFPNDIPARIHLAAVLLAAGDQQAAMQELRDVLRAAPSSVSALLRLARLTDGHEHLDLVSRLCGIRPSFGFKLMLAAALEKANRWEEAVAVYESAAALKQDSAIPFIKTAAILLRERKWHAAGVAARQAAELEPQNSYCRILLQKSLEAAEAIGSTA